MSYLYPTNIEAKIGFDTVRLYLKERCQSPIGVRHVEEMRFVSDYEQIVNRLCQTDEMKRIYEYSESLPDIAFNELHLWLPALQIENSYASPEDYYRLKQSIVSYSNIRSFFLKREGEGEENPFLYPHLANLFLGMKSFPVLVNEIERVIDKNGGVKDSASPELAEVRQKLSSMQGSISRAIQRILSYAIKEGVVEKDTAPTIREGRMVIPVSAGNKKRIQGIVHDESATGKTVFIEPAETVELSNRFKELQLEEQRIIIRILCALADTIRPFINDILESNTLTGYLDFIMAKAKFAIEISAQLPIINKRPEMDWYGAVHPVLFFNLKKKEGTVIPLDIRLEGKKRILIISGPNAGGKSVALKTVGLIQYMLQCGVLPTLYSNSHVGIFNKIFIDIGDEQSLENDLSTYSSHLKNMRQFLLHADGKSLILIDEIGSGTEPTIGAALAKSILIKLSESRCFGIVTTHYHSLKSFAEESEFFINGAMLYDRQKLQPTFKLSIGTAGSSFALEIAAKIGLPKNIIDLAKQEVGDDYVESDKFLMEIARDRKYWLTKRSNIKEKEQHLTKLEEKYETLISDLNNKRNEILKQAQEEAKELLSETNKRIENTIQEIRKSEAEKERTKKLRQELESYKKDVEDTALLKGKIEDTLIQKKRRIRRNVKESKSNPATGNSDQYIEKKLSEGDYVKMEGAFTAGKIISISGNEAEVAFGNIRSKVKLNKLKSVPKPTQSTTSETKIINGNVSDFRRNIQLNFKDELDIRGLRADEALDRLIHYVDEAIQIGARKVRILHGTGSGILRQIVRQQLAASSGIAKFEDEDVRLGGAGVTVITFR